MSDYVEDYSPILKGCFNCPYETENCKKQVTFVTGDYTTKIIVSYFNACKGEEYEISNDIIDAIRNWT